MAANDVIGKPLPAQTDVIERGPVMNFARAVKDDSPIYSDPSAAAEAGLGANPAPPTYAFAMHHFGAFPDLQPEGAGDTNPIMDAIGALMQSGGLVLHGEQEFVYHRPIQVGDVLTSRGTIKDLYEKQGSSDTMTFVVTETEWLDQDQQPVVTSLMTLLHRA